NAPILTWTGESGFTSDAVDPDYGTVNVTLFTYKVRYYDADGNPPKYVHLWIYKDGKSIFGSPFPMGFVPTSGNLADGDYYANISFTESGNYTYLIEAKEKPGINLNPLEIGSESPSAKTATLEAIGEPSLVGEFSPSQVDIFADLGEDELIMVDWTDGVSAVGPATLEMVGPIIGQAPVLSWTGEPDYEGGGVYPTSTSPSGYYTYRIKYQDPDGDAPDKGYVYVKIYRDGKLYYPEPIAIPKVSGDPVNGQIHSLSYPLTQSGNYTCLFEAKDIDGIPAEGTPTFTFTVGPIIANPPVLSWTGEPNYQEGGVYPISTSPHNLYTYRIKYQDPAGNQPYGNRVYVKVYREGNLLNTLPMSYVSGNPQTGQIHSVQYPLTLEGIYTYIFEAKNINGVSAEGTPTVTLMVGPIIGQPPVLSWAGISDYVYDGIEPETGKSGDTFTYLVKYTDDDNDPPLAGYPLLYVFRGDNEAVPGSPYVMDHNDPLDITYTDGKLYKKELSLRLTGTDYKYRFEVKDIKGVSSVYPQSQAMGTKTGPTISNPPVLSFISQTPYNGTSGVDIQTGAKPKVVTFKVIYQDIDGDCPSPTDNVRVYIRRNGAGYPYEGIYYSMLYKVPIDYVKGVEYYSVINLPYSGTYTYRFAAKDRNGVLAPGTPTQEYIGPILTGVDAPVAPLLLWTGERNYLYDGLDPEQGEPNSTIFTYRVKYSDGNNEAPLDGYPRVKIKTTGGTETILPLTRVSPATVTYAAGVLYETRTTLPAPTGIYTYQFEAKDITGLTAGGAGIQVKIAPTVNSAPVLSNGTVNPTNGNVSTLYTFSVKYQDSEGTVPHSGYPKVHILIGGVDIPGSPIILPYHDGGNISSGRVYSNPLILSYNNSNYSYYFEAMDIYRKMATPTSTNDGPVVTGGGNCGPELLWVGTGGYVSDGLEPEMGTRGTIFTF
ncbi:MAG: hypothetical protein AB1422_18680, partial [bacterium]